MASITRARSPADLPSRKFIRSLKLRPWREVLSWLAASQFAAFARQSTTEVDWSLVCSNHLHFSVGSEKSELVANCDQPRPSKVFRPFCLPADTGNVGIRSAPKTKGLSCLWTFQPGRPEVRISPVLAIFRLKRALLRRIECGPEISHGPGLGVGKVHA